MATTLLVAVFLLVSVTMILIVLIQRPQGGGLSGAFGAGGGGGGGGSGAGQTAFGTKTGDVLTMGTIGIFVLFLVLAVVLNFATRPPQPADNTPQLVAPGTPREALDESENSADEPSAQAPDGSIEDALGDELEETADAVEDGLEGVDEAVEQGKELLEPLTEPSTDPNTDPSDG